MECDNRIPDFLSGKVRKDVFTVASFEAGVYTLCEVFGIYACPAEQPAVGALAYIYYVYI